MEASITYYHLICIVTSILSVSMGLFLIFVKSKKNQANLFLGLLLLCYSLFFMPGFFESIGLLDTFPHIIRINFFSGALVGPLTYLYCKSSIHKLSLGIKKNILHFIPFVVSFIYFWPTLILSGDEKILIYHTVITEGKVPEKEYVIIILSLLTILYTIISINIVGKYLKHLKDVRSSIDASFHQWLFFLSCSLLFPTLAVLLIIITNINVISVLASMFTIATFVIIVYITLTLKPKFFEYIPDQITDSPEEAKEKSKYQSSNLQEAQKIKYQSKIVKFMNNEKPFLDPEITINQFSEQLNIPSYYVSQIINERLKVNFLDFVNKFRIEEAKLKLIDEDLNHYTIVTIAYDSGFNSKTAFYSAFKKHVGETPSHFRKKNQTVLV